MDSFGDVVGSGSEVTCAVAVQDSYAYVGFDSDITRVDVIFKPSNYQGDYVLASNLAYLPKL